MSNPTVQLTAFNVFVRPIGSMQNLKPSNFDNGVRLNDAIQQILESFIGAGAYTHKSQSLLVKSCNAVSDRRLEFQISSGSAGLLGSVIDANDEIKLPIEPSDKVIHPSHCEIWSDDRKDRALLLFQSVKHRPSHGILTQFLSHEFSLLMKGYRLVIERLVPSGILKQILESSDLNSIEFIKYKAPQLIERYLREREVSEHEAGTVRITISGGNAVRRQLEKILNWANGRGEISTIYSIPGFQYDDIATDLKTGGRHRRILLSKADRLRWYDEITERVRFVDMVPSRDDIRSECAEAAKTYLLDEGV